MKYRVLSHSLFTAALLMAIACDMTDLESGSSNLSIRCAIDGIEETRASLVTTDNVATKYPTMTAYVVSTATKTQAFDAEDFNTADAATSLTLKNSVWKEGEYALFSYPINAISPAMENGKLKLTDSKMKFDYEIAKNSTDTPDIVVAGVTATRGSGVIELNYKHIFTAVNVIYKDPQIGHRVTSIKVKDAYTKGTCTCDMNGNIAWSGQNTKADLVDSGTRGATYANQVLTEDGCKFMVIPEPSTDDGKITIEVVVDGVTITKRSENASGPGDIVNFYIGDRFDLTTTEGVKTSGKVEENEDGTYKMTIESYITGEFHSETHTTSAATDYILVLDNSGSMTWDLNGYNRTPKRIDLLRDAASNFIEKVREDAEKSNVDHRISIVSFGKPEYPGGSRDACKAYVTPGSSTYLQETAITSTNKGVLTQVIKGWTKDMAAAKTAVQSMDAQGGNTASALGMELAYQLLLSKREGAVPVIIFFTDGKPENVGGESSWTVIQQTTINKVSSQNTSKVQVANETVEAALKCKNAGAEVFSIGIFSSDADNCKKYCETVSSNYPQASAVFQTNSTKTDDTKRGAKRTDGKNYFFYVSDEKGLDNAFITIQQTVISSHPSIDIHEDAYMQVIVSEAFKLPENYVPGNSVSFYTCAQTGYNPETKVFTFSDTLVPITGLTLVPDLNTKTFTVSGFDYAANFCTITSLGSNMGKKLVIVIDGLEVNPERQGTGTNETIVYTTGLYNNSEALSQIDPAGMTVEY